MSKIEVNAIEPQSGTSLTLGASGDTITVPAGATFDSSAATNTLPSTVVTTTGTQTLTNKSIATTQLTGTVAASNLGTGTADATTFLRGDQTYAEAGGGLVLQVVSVTKDSTFTTTSGTFVDVTGLSVSITPSSASNKILVLYNVSLSNTTSTAATLTRILRDSTPISIGASGTGVQASGHVAVYNYNQGNVSISYLDSPSTTSATTYKVQLSTEPSYTATLNRGQLSSIYGLTASSITLMEVAG